MTIVFSSDLLQAESLLKETDPIVDGNSQLSDSYYKKSNRAAQIFKKSKTMKTNDKERQVLDEVYVHFLQVSHL